MKMKFENAKVFNFEGALHGMRNPLESWAKSDSGYNCVQNEEKLCDSHCVVDNYCDTKMSKFIIGKKDLDLAQRLIKGGPPHSKFLRQIFVTIDITAPLYFWKELDTYKIGTTANSTSTMHKLSSTPITKECFEMDDYDSTVKLYDMEPWSLNIYINEIWEDFIHDLETLRKKYNETKDVRYWKELIRLLPESWLQTRTWTANYEVLRNIVHWRSKHKLSEWHQLVDFIKTLPYAEELIFYNNVPE